MAGNMSHRTFAKAPPAQGWSSRNSTLNGVNHFMLKNWKSIPYIKRDRFLSLAQSLMRFLLAEVCEVEVCEVRMSKFAAQRIESNINLHVVWFLMVKPQFFLLSTELTILFASVSQSRTQPMQRRMFRYLCPPLQFRISSWVVPGPWTPTAIEPAGGCWDDPSAAQIQLFQDDARVHPNLTMIDTQKLTPSKPPVVMYHHFTSFYGVIYAVKPHGKPMLALLVSSLKNWYGSTVRMNPWNRSLSPIDPPFLVIKKTCEPYPKINIYIYCIINIIYIYILYKIYIIYIYNMLYTYPRGTTVFPELNPREFTAGGSPPSPPASSFANGPPFSARNRRLSGSDAFRAPGPRKPKDPRSAQPGIAEANNQMPEILILGAEICWNMLKSYKSHPILGYWGWFVIITKKIHKTLRFH